MNSKQTCRRQAAPVEESPSDSKGSGSGKRSRVATGGHINHKQPRAAMFNCITSSPLSPVNIHISCQVANDGRRHHQVSCQHHSAAHCDHHQLPLTCCLSYLQQHKQQQRQQDSKTNTCIVRKGQASKVIELWSNIMMIVVILLSMSTLPTTSSQLHRQQQSSSDDEHITREVTNLVIYPGYRAVKLRWRYGDQLQDKQQDEQQQAKNEPASFKVRFCEIASWNVEIKCRERRLELEDQVSPMAGVTKRSATNNNDNSSSNSSSSSSDYLSNSGHNSSNQFSSLSPTSQQANGNTLAADSTTSQSRQSIKGPYLMTKSDFVVHHGHHNNGNGAGGGGQHNSIGSNDYEAEIFDLRALTNYTFHVQVDRFKHEQQQQQQQHQRSSSLLPMGRKMSTQADNSNSINSATSKLQIETKGFGAEASKCLANLSEVIVNTGRYFGGRISVEGSNDPRCNVFGNKSSAQSSYKLAIIHDICGSRIVNNTRIETMILVHENKDILTHNSGRFLVVCNFVEKSFTLRASVSLPKVNGVAVRTRPATIVATSNPAQHHSRPSGVFSGVPVQLGTMPGRYKQRSASNTGPSNMATSARSAASDDDQLVELSSDNSPVDTAHPMMRQPKDFSSTTTTAVHSNDNGLLSQQPAVNYSSPNGQMDHQQNSPEARQQVRSHRLLKHGVYTESKPIYVLSQKRAPQIVETTSSSADNDDADGVTGADGETGADAHTNNKHKGANFVVLTDNHHGHTSNRNQRQMMMMPPSSMMQSNHQQHNNIFAAATSESPPPQDHTLMMATNNQHMEPMLSNEMFSDAQTLAYYPSMLIRHGLSKPPLPPLAPLSPMMTMMASMASMTPSPPLMTTTPSTPTTSTTTATTSTATATATTSNQQSTGNRSRTMKMLLHHHNQFDQLLDDTDDDDAPVTNTLHTADDLIIMHNKPTMSSSAEKQDTNTDGQHQQRHLLDPSPVNYNHQQQSEPSTPLNQQQQQTVVDDDEIQQRSSPGSGEFFIGPVPISTTTTTTTAAPRFNFVPVVSTLRKRNEAIAFNQQHSDSRHHHQHPVTHQRHQAQQQPPHRIEASFDDDKYPFDGTILATAGAGGQTTGKEEEKREISDTTTAVSAPLPSITQPHLINNNGSSSSSSSSLQNSLLRWSLNTLASLAEESFTKMVNNRNRQRMTTPTPSLIAFGDSSSPKTALADDEVHITREQQRPVASSTTVKPPQAVMMQSAGDDVLQQQQFSVATRQSQSITIDQPTTTTMTRQAKHTDTSNIHGQDQQEHLNSNQQVFVAPASANTNDISDSHNTLDRPISLASTMPTEASSNNRQKLDLHPTASMQIPAKGGPSSSYGGNNHLVDSSATISNSTVGKIANGHQYRYNQHRSNEHNQFTNGGALGNYLLYSVVIVVAGLIGCLIASALFMSSPHNSLTKRANQPFNRWSHNHDAFSIITNSDYVDYNPVISSPPLPHIGTNTNQQILQAPSHKQQQQQLNRHKMTAATSATASSVGQPATQAVVRSTVSTPSSGGGEQYDTMTEKMRQVDTISCNNSTQILQIEPALFMSMSPTNTATNQLSSVDAQFMKYQSAANNDLGNKRQHQVSSSRQCDSLLLIDQANCSFGEESYA